MQLTWSRDLTTTLPDQIPLPVGFRSGPVTESDSAEIAALMFASYGPENDVPSLELAVQEMADVFAGEFGPLMAGGSGVVRDGGGCIRSVVLTVTRAPWPDTPDGPFIIDAFTDRVFRGRFLARALIVDAVHAAAGAGEDVIALRVLSENSSACRLYSGLGFGE